MANQVTDRVTVGLPWSELPGEAGEIVSATATELPPGSEPTVTLGGTPSERTLEFGIPVGEKGDPGSGSVNSVNGDLGPDVVLDAADVGAVPSTQNATTTQRGIVELATNTEAVTGTDTVRAVTPSGLKAAIDAGGGGGSGGASINPADHGVPTNGTTNAQPAMQALINSMADGSIIEGRPGQRFNINAPLNLSKPMTLRGGEYIANTSGPTLLIDSDDVTIDGVTITGPGAAGGVVTDQRFINSTGTSANRHARTKIINCKMTGSQSSFIWVYWLTDFLIADNYLEDGQYSGVSLLSCKSGVVRGNTIRTMRMGGSLVNCYGIAATDSTNDIAGRSEDVLIEGNYVDGMLEWEGIDTHGGKNISVIGNTVRNCRTPIAITTGNAARVVPPESCTVIGNFVEKGSATSETAGIVFNGKSGGSLPDRIAHGTIGHNVIRGFQADIILELYDPSRTTVAPQSHNGPIRRSPTQAPYRSFSAVIDVTVLSGQHGAVQTLSFPSGLFTQPPVVMVSKQTGAGARHIPYASGPTTTQVAIGLYDPHQSGTSATAVVGVIAVQMNPDGLGVSGA